MDRYEAYERSTRAGLIPDITFLMDLSYKEARKRGRSRKRDRMERKSALFHEKVRRGFLARARQHKKRFRVLDGSKKVGAIETEIWGTVEDELG
jgi:dTMP kinase